MKRIIRGMALMAALLWMITAGAGAEGIHTETRNDTIEMEILTGYDGRITYGKTVPIRVTVRNRGAEDLEGTLGVDGYVSEEKYDRFETAISIPAGGERTYVLPVISRVKQDVFTVSVRQREQVICTENIRPNGVINPSAMLVGVLSTRPAKLSNLDISQENDTLFRYEYWETVALTPETLPEQISLLNSFGVIVLDDTDPALLTEKQREALCAWVKGGRILLCGGGSYGPQNLALLDGMTALKTEEFTVSDGVLPALEAYTGKALSGRAPEIAVARLSGAEPLVSDAAGNGLVYRETAGNGRIYTIAWEAGDATLNADPLMHTFFQTVFFTADSSLYSSCMYSGEAYYPAIYNAGNGYPMATSASLIPGILIAAAPVILGCGLWFLLRKKGKTSLLWAAIPVLAAAAGVCLFLMSTGSSLNAPAAVSTVNLVQTAEGAVTRYTGITAAAPGQGLHSFSLAGAELKPNLYDENDWYDSGEKEEDRKIQPSRLRLIRRSGSGEMLTLNADTSWETMSFSGVAAADMSGKIEAEIWMEQDGLHGTIRNGTTMDLAEGIVLTNYGFVRTGDLASGAETDFVLLAASAADPYDPKYENAKMLTNAVSNGLYAVTVAAWETNAEKAHDDIARREALSSMANCAAEQLGADGQTYSGGISRNTFVFCAEPRGMEETGLLIDGKKPGTEACLALLTAEMTYLTTGRTGVVFHAAGTDRPQRCRLNENDMPAGIMPTSDYSVYSIPLAEKPTFCFDSGDAREAEITRLVIGMDSWYTDSVHCYLLNSYLKTWEEIRLNEPVKNPALYLDRNGMIYCQFRQATQENAYDIPMPSLELEGRVKDAEP